jgi:hypothetical protein
MAYASTCPVIVFILWVTTGRVRDLLGLFFFKILPSRSHSSLVSLEISSLGWMGLIARAFIFSACLSALHLLQ